jgi:hypothetical protein
MGFGSCPYCTHCTYQTYFNNTNCHAVPPMGTSALRRLARCLCRYGHRRIQRHPQAGRTMEETMYRRRARTHSRVPHPAPHEADFPARREQYARGKARKRREKGSFLLFFINFVPKRVNGKDMRGSAPMPSGTCRGATSLKQKGFAYKQKRPQPLNNKEVVHKQ